MTTQTSIGTLLSAVVNRVSHGSGETLQIMADAQVTLQQVLLLTRLGEASPSSASDLAGRLHLSLPAVSQAVDRLVRLGLVTRVEDPEDRRKKCLSPTAKATRLLERLNQARSREYAIALSVLPAAVESRLAALLRQTLRHLESK